MLRSNLYAGGSNYSNIETLLGRYGSLLNAQRIWAVEWQEIADYVIPRKNSILVQRIPGDKRTRRLYDSTAIHASELLAASIHGTLTPSYMRWFWLETDDDELNKISNVAIWSDQVSRIMNSELNRSNFHAEAHEFYTDLTTFATGVLLGNELPKKDGQFNGLVFSTCPAGRYVISEGPNHMVDTIFRSFTLPLSAVFTRWPDAKFPTELKGAEGKQLDIPYEIIHCILPKESRGGLDYKWESQYILYKTKTSLSESGFFSFPAMVCRWTKYTDETYGRGQTHTAMPDIRSINKIVELELKKAAKNVDPPMGAISGDVIGQARLVPAGITSVRQKDALFPIETGSQTGNQWINLKKEELKKSIEAIYHADQLQLPMNGPQMTATESNLRYELMQRILGPTLGRLDVEYAHPLLDRTFDILWRAGVLPPLPMELQNATQVKKIQLRVRYDGPLARAQKSADVTAIQSLFGMVEPLAQSKPEALDVIDFDEAIRVAGNTLGVPASIIKDKDQVEQIRQAREEEQQKQQQQQQITQASEAAKNFAPAIKAANQKPEEGSPSDQMGQGQQ